MVVVTLQPITVGLGRYSFGLLRNSPPVRYGCARGPVETTPVSIGSSSYSSSGSRNLSWKLGLGLFSERRIARQSLKLRGVHAFPSRTEWVVNLFFVHT